MNIRIYSVPLLVAVFSLVIIALALQLDTSPPMIVGDSMQPRVFPIFLMVLNLILTAILFLQYRKNPPAMLDRDPIATWGTILLMVPFYLLATYVDLFIAIAIVVFAMSLLWGEKGWWAALLTAIATPAFLFLLFDSVLKIRFPRGLFTNWWYS
ncbi:MAG: tripartite tricarboxylate transporter TctB family protein [Pseudomonadota bacterium]